MRVVATIIILDQVPYVEKLNSNHKMRLYTFQYSDAVLMVRSEMEDPKTSD